MSTPDDTDTDRAAGTASPATPAARDGAPVTGSPARKPTPAASAASRARRIGGAPVTRPTAAAQPEAPAEPVTPAAGRRRWNLTKDAAAATPTSSTAATTSTASATAAGGSTATSGDTVVLPASPKPGRRLSLPGRRSRTTSTAGRSGGDTDVPQAVPQVPTWLRWVPAIVLGACAVAMLVLIAVSARGVWYDKPSTSAARDKVLAAAKKCTATANSYSYKTLAADEKRGLACTTGAWTAQYKSALEKIVKPTATKLKATQTVQINAAGVESVSSDAQQWTTIVYGQLTINQSGATPRVDPFAAVVRLDKVKSGYLISKIDLITNPSA